MLILDCLKINSHPSHFNLEQAILISELIRPKKTILTNLHTDLDYNFLKKNLPKNITKRKKKLTIFKIKLDWIKLR